MIDFIIPPAGTLTYLLADYNVWVGPLETMADVKLCTSPLAHPISEFEEKIGIGGVDNDVTHRTVDGVLSISPLHEMGYNVLYSGLSGYYRWDMSGGLGTVIGVKAWETSGNEITVVDCSFYQQKAGSLVFWCLDSYKRYTATLEQAALHRWSISSVSGRRLSAARRLGFRSNGAEYSSSVQGLIQMESWPNPDWEDSGTSWRFLTFNNWNPKPSYAFDIEKCFALFEAARNTLLPEPEPTTYNDLAAKAVEDTRIIKTNMLSFLADLKHIDQLIPKLTKMNALKDASNLFLTEKYGILPTISDLQAIIDGMTKNPYTDKLGHATYKASKTSKYDHSGLLTHRTRHIKIAVEAEESRWQELYQRFRSFGIFPEFASLWDLVPYSFVVDWFIDIGSFLESVDTRLLYQSLDISYVTMSDKIMKYFSISPTVAVPISGQLIHRYYHRWTSDQCPVPPLSLSPTAGFNHWLEAAALIIQRK